MNVYTKKGRSTCPSGPFEAEDLRVCSQRTAGAREVAAFAIGTKVGETQ